MSEGTASKLKLSDLERQKVKTVKEKEIFKIGSFTILPFKTQHDCKEPLGFLIQSGNDKILFATDTYYLRYKFYGVTHFMLECNYCEDILDQNVKSGKITEFLRNRITKSHFSLGNVKEFFKVADLSKCKEIHLLHLSNDNSSPELFRTEIQKQTGKPVYIKGE